MYFSPQSFEPGFTCEETVQERLSNWLEVTHLLGAGTALWAQIYGTHPPSDCFHHYPSMETLTRRWVKKAWWCHLFTFDGWKSECGPHRGHRVFNLQKSTTNGGTWVPPGGKQLWTHRKKECLTSEVFGLGRVLNSKKDVLTVFSASRILQYIWPQFLGYFLAKTSQLSLCHHVGWAGDCGDGIWQKDKTKENKTDLT